MAKGEIAHIEQFLFLSLYFQKLFAAEASESIYMWESDNVSFMFIVFNFLPLKIERRQCGTRLRNV